MRLTKYTHACVRLDDGDRALLIDPGAWSESEPLHGADAVIVTHKHLDHVDEGKLAEALKANPDLKIFTNVEVAETLTALGDAVTTVTVGDPFDAGGFQVRAVGGRHAIIHGQLPQCANLGYLVTTPTGNLYYPGDSLDRPGEPVDTLLIPTCAPWLKLTEAIDFLVDVAPRLAVSTHDAMLTDKGHWIVDGWLGDVEGVDYRRLDIGESLELVA